MTPLQAALAEWEEWPYRGTPLPDNTVAALADAALLLAEGETIWWCEKHAARGMDEMACTAQWHPLYDPDEDGPCSMVEKILADPPGKVP